MAAGLAVGATDAGSGDRSGVEPGALGARLDDVMPLHAAVSTVQSTATATKVAERRDTLCNMNLTDATPRPGGLSTSRYGVFHD